MTLLGAFLIGLGLGLIHPGLAITFMGALCIICKEDEPKAPHSHAPAPEHTPHSS